MKSQDQFMDAKEAASFMGVNYTVLYWYQSKGVIQGHYLPGKRARQFKKEDILALKERVDRNKEKGVRTRRHHLKRRVRELEVNVEQLIREVDKLKTYTGMDLVMLPTDEKGVAALYIEARRICAMKTVKPEEVQKWLMIFAVISEKFLSLVHEQFNDPEPWKIFVNVAEVIEEAIGADGELIKHAEYARRNLRNAMYSTAFKMYGAKTANTIFEKVEYCDRVIKSMFMVWEFKVKEKES